MGYSARRGFTNGSMKMTGAQRQAEMQARIQQMQEQVNAAQEAVEAQEFTASVGGGVVEAKVNGKKEVLAVTIKPEAVDPEDVEMLQDLVVSAVNEALRQARRCYLWHTSWIYGHNQPPPDDTMPPCAASG